MRSMGLTNAEIADQMDLHPNTISNYIHTALKRVEVEEASQIKLIQHLRLEHYHAVLARRINEGDDKAISLGLQIHDRIAHLHGIQAAHTERTTTNTSNTLVMIGGDKTEMMDSLRSHIAMREAREAALTNTVEAVVIDDDTTDTDITQALHHEDLTPEEAPPPPSQDSHGSSTPHAP